MSQFTSPQAGVLGSLVIEQLNDLVYVFDRELRFLYVNDSACRILGYAREELLAASAVVIGADNLGPKNQLGKLPGDGSRLTEPGAIALQGLLRQTFATKVPCDHEFTLPAKDGKIFYWHLRVIPEFDEDKAVTSLLTVWSEVTDRKHLLASLDRMAYHDALTEPIIWKGTLLRIGASVGLARYPEDGLDADSLLQRADESMYCEKARRQSRAGRGVRMHFSYRDLRNSTIAC